MTLLMTSPRSVLLGEQTPRVSCVPSTGVTSAGVEAVELARSVGLVLDPWQQFVLEGALGERSDGRWSAFEVALVVGRQNGKGSILEARELAGLFLFGEELILHSAHEFKTSQEAFRRVLARIESKDHLRKRVKRVRTSHGEEGVELTTGARLRFVARSTGSGRGFSGDCVILDEAYNLGGEAMAALLPTLSARPNPQIWYASSAGMHTSEQLLRVRERGAAGDSPRLAYFEWSADPLLSLDDRQAWAQANPALGIRISEEFVASERAALGDAEFGRERLGYWPNTRGEQVIDPQVWASRADPGSQVVDPVVFAVDGNPERSAASIAVVGRREDGLVHAEVVESRRGIGWVAGRVAELEARWKPVAWVLDPASAVGSLIPDLQVLGVEPVSVSGRELAQACGAFYDAVVETGLLRHLNQDQLNLALSGARQRALGDAWAWHRKNSAVNITPLVAVTLAFYGFAKHCAAGESAPQFFAATFR